MLVPKLLPTPIKIRIFGPKRPNFAQNYLFWPNIASFGTFGPMPDQETIQTRCVGGFSVTLVLKLLLPPERKRIFGPKFITGQNGVHLVREISPWSSHVLCIGLVET